ncbi:hypothetical protein [Polaromonas sp.]|uniref:hypothetical protein n=1 Tax=Polaromonas sp. TaxID=1869339 RepID=UPI003CC09F53
MTPPTASTIATLALVPLLTWRIWIRFRRARGRQRLSRYRGPVTLTLYGLLLGAIALANWRYPAHLLAFALALALGAGLAVFALRRTRFEPTPAGLYYTPHGPIGIALAVLFVARLAYRAVEVYIIDSAAQRSFAEFAHHPATLGAFGLMAGYYVCYTVSLVRWRHRVLRAKRQREANSPVKPEPPPT